MYRQHYDSEGACIGVVRVADGVVIPRSGGNRDWQDFVRWNASSAAPLDLADLTPPQRRRPRTLAAIKADLEKLSPARLQRIVLHLLACELAGNPSLARDAGELIDGDEPV